MDIDELKRLAEGVLPENWTYDNDEAYQEKVTPAVILQLILQGEELAKQVAEWERLSRNWLASPEAAQRLSGYQELARKTSDACDVAEKLQAELLAERARLDFVLSKAIEVRRLRDEVNGLTGSLDRAEKALKEAQEQEQEPVAFWWIGPDGKDNGGPYRGKPSDAAIDNALNMGCEPVLLYARPVPAAPAVAFNISDNVDANTSSAERIDDNSSAPAVAVPAIDIETILNASTATMCQCLRSRLLASEVRRLRALLQSAPQPAVAAPAVQKDCVSQDESTMMMAASALVLYRAGESAEYMAKAIEALLQSSEGCCSQDQNEVRHD